MDNKYEWYLITPGLYYEPSPKFVHAKDLAATQGFASLYSVSEADSKAIQSAGTTKGFAGNVWSERLWLDFDSYEAGQRAQITLREMELDHVTFDTGGRGLHIGVLRRTEALHTLPRKDRAWVATHFPEADISIYSHLHLFRLPGTVHSATGRAKELLFQYKGKVLELPLLDVSRAQLPLRSAFNSAPSIFDCPLVMRYTIAVDTGDRHANLVKLTYALRDEASASREAAHLWVAEVNKAFKVPKDDAAIQHIVDSIYG